MPEVPLAAGTHVTYESASLGRVLQMVVMSHDPTSNTYDLESRDCEQPGVKKRKAAAAKVALAATAEGGSPPEQVLAAGSDGPGEGSAIQAAAPSDVRRPHDRFPLGHVSVGRGQQEVLACPHVRPVPSWASAQD